MDLCTLVKAGCIGSACLLMQGVDPLVRADSAPAAPGVELHGLPDYRPSQLGIPGLFPGRPVVGRDQNAIVRDRISQPIVRRLLDQAMKELTGKNSAQGAWAKFIEPKNVVGIKINPFRASHPSGKTIPITLRSTTTSFSTTPPRSVPPPAGIH